MKKIIFLSFIIIFTSCNSPKKESNSIDKPLLFLSKVKWTIVYKNEVMKDSNFFSYDAHNRLKALSMYGINVDSLVYDQSGKVISFRKSDVNGITKSSVSYLLDKIVINSRITTTKPNQSSREYTLTANFKKDKSGRIELEKESCFEYDNEGDVYEKESCLTQRSKPKDTIYANPYNLVGNSVFWEIITSSPQYGNRKKITINSYKILSTTPFNTSAYSIPVNKKYPKKEIVDFGDGKMTVEYEYKKGN